MSLMRGDYESASEYLQRAADAYGAYGRQTSKWYEWSVRVISARLAIRRGYARRGARRSPTKSCGTPDAPPAEVLQGELIGIEALLAAERIDEAEARLTRVESTHRSAIHTRARGASSFGCAAISAGGSRGPARRITTSRRARACSISSASAIRRASVSWRSAVWPPAPARAPPRNVTASRRPTSSSRSAPRAISQAAREALPATQQLGHRRIRRFARRMPTTR